MLTASTAVSDRRSLLKRVNHKAEKEHSLQFEFHLLFVEPSERPVHEL